MNTLQHIAYSPANTCPGYKIVQLTKRLFSVTNTSVRQHNLSQCDAENVTLIMLAVFMIAFHLRFFLLVLDRTSWPHSCRDAHAWQ